MAYKIHKYNNQLTKDQNVLLERLYKFRVSNMAEALEKQFLDPNSGLEDFNTRIAAITNYEQEQRDARKFNSLLKRLHLNIRQLISMNCFMNRIDYWIHTP